MLFHRMSIISLGTRHEWVDKKGKVTIAKKNGEPHPPPPSGFASNVYDACISIVWSLNI